MELATIVQDIHRLNHELERFERKYGIMSETFYQAYMAGEEPADDAWGLDLKSGATDTWLTLKRFNTSAQKSPCFLRSFALWRCRVCWAMHCRTRNYSPMRCKMTIPPFRYQR